MSAVRDILADTNGCQVVPGAYDRTSAALVAAEGFPAVYLSGASIQGSYAGFEDEPAVADFLESARHVAGATGLPLIVDGEDGFVTPSESVRALVEAGAAAVHVEDFSPTGGFVEPEDFVRRLGEVAAAVADLDGMLIARTDGVRTSPEEAIARAQRYADTEGVDAVLPFLGPLLQPDRKADLLDFLDRLVAAVDVPVVAYAPLGHELTAAECTEHGVPVLLVPHLLLGTATGAMRRALGAVRDPEAVAEFVRENEVWSLPRLRGLF
ncbi:isocitrate lyase/PEP mutase family protein [Streptomyces sp. NPDC001393]